MNYADYYGGGGHSSPQPAYGQHPYQYGGGGYGNYLSSGNFNQQFNGEQSYGGYQPNTGQYQSRPPVNYGMYDFEGRPKSWGYQRQLRKKKAGQQGPVMPFDPSYHGAGLYHNKGVYQGYNMGPDSMGTNYAAQYRPKTTAYGYR